MNYKKYHIIIYVVILLEIIVSLSLYFSVNAIDVCIFMIALFSLIPFIRVKGYQEEKSNLIYMVLIIIMELVNILNKKYCFFTVSDLFTIYGIVMSFMLCIDLFMKNRKQAK